MIALLMLWTAVVVGAGLSILLGSAAEKTKTKGH